MRNFYIPILLIHRNVGVVAVIVDVLEVKPLIFHGWLIWPEQYVCQAGACDGLLVSRKEFIFLRYKILLCRII